MHSFTTFAEAEKALEQFLPSKLPRFAYTTEYIARFLSRIGSPQDRQPAIHIAGTSGKTSTAYYAAALLKASGKRVGLLTSPHLEQLSERVQIDMQPLDEPTFCRELATFLTVVKKSGITLSHAELLYAFAFWEFARRQVEIVVVEVGMGGLHDATNVMTRPDKVCVITDIGLDHTRTLGNTLSEIAAHKAGIIGPGNAVFCHEQTPEIMRVIRHAAKEKGAALHVLAKSAPTSAGVKELPLFQQRNFMLALAAAAEMLNRRPDPAIIRQAVRTHIPGRLEILRYKDKAIILDGAHNPQKLAVLGQSLPAKPRGNRGANSRDKAAAMIAFTVSSGRSVDLMLAQLAPYVNHLLITTFPRGGMHTARKPEEIAAACDRAGISSYAVIHDPGAALKALLDRPEHTLLVTGSLYLLGHIRPMLRTILKQT